MNEPISNALENEVITHGLAWCEGCLEEFGRREGLAAQYIMYALDKYVFSNRFVAPIRPIGKDLEGLASVMMVTTCD